MDFTCVTHEPPTGVRHLGKQEDARPHRAPTCRTPWAFAPALYFVGEVRVRWHTRLVCWSRCGQCARDRGGCPACPAWRFLGASYAARLALTFCACPVSQRRARAGPCGFGASSAQGRGAARGGHRHAARHGAEDPPEQLLLPRRSRVGAKDAVSPLRDGGPSRPGLCACLLAHGGHQVGTFSVAAAKTKQDCCSHADIARARCG